MMRFAILTLSTMCCCATSGCVHIACICSAGGETICASALASDPDASQKAVQSAIDQCAAKGGQIQGCFDDPEGNQCNSRIDGLLSPTADPVRYSADRQLAQASGDQKILAMVRAAHAKASSWFGWFQ